MPIHIPTPTSPFGPPCCPSRLNCCDQDCPDHSIRRHDTKPAFRVNVENCDGPLELEGLVLEANMWAKGRLRQAILSTDTYFQLADNIGFDQIMVGDIIIMNRVRQPEHMLVTAFDEEQYFVQVQRGYNGTTPGNWKKGSGMRIFRVLNSPAITESRFEDRDQLDGMIDKDILSESYLVYEWQPEDTCLPGCYWFEFKLIKMKQQQFFLPGGKWIGVIHTDSSGNYMTGSVDTDSSVIVSFGIGDPYDLIRHIRNQLPQILYDDPNFVEPIIPTPDQDNYDLWRYIIHLYPNDCDANLRWQIWDRLVHLHLNGVYYNLPYNTHWSGPMHLWSDANWYTGTNHDDGSVYLDANGVVPNQKNDYNSSGIVSILCDGDISQISCDISVVPSFGVTDFSNISQIDTDFGCSLGVGVEWVQRYPVSGEGFKIRIYDSPTAE